MCRKRKEILSVIPFFWRYWVCVNFLFTRKETFLKIEKNNDKKKREHLTIIKGQEKLSHPLTLYA